MWGLLSKKGFLSLWVFEGSSGVSIYRLYNASKVIIDHKRLVNPFYAENFEWLYNKIKSKYKRDMDLFLELEQNNN